MKRIASIFALVGAPHTPLVTAYAAHFVRGIRGVRCALALSLLLSLFAGIANADIKTLHNNGQVTWGTENNPQVIYLLDGEVCTQDDAYDEIVLKFTGTEAPGTLTIGTGVKVSTRALVVGGGGAGGTSTNTTAGAGGGGGAGGFIDQTQTIVAGTYTITVGAGGTAATTLDTAQGADGSDSSFVGGTVSLVANGGGGGGALSVGRPGGSGGGGSYTSATCNGGSGTTGQGNAGGSGSSKKYGAGGGGAGSDGTKSGSSAKGGVGLASDIVLDENGDPIYYAGGGGGGRTTLTTGIAGGNGGGGKGGSTTVDAEPGQDSLGGGGGGGGSISPGGRGGDGVVILRVRDLLILPPSDVELEWDGENQVGYVSKNYYEIVDVAGDATNATVAGTYRYHVKPADGFMWVDGQWTTSDTETKTIEWKIVPMQVDVPTSVSIVYDGASHEVASSDEICEIVDGTAVATNAGEYSFTMRLRDADNTIWSDGTTTDKTTPWSIVAKAVSKPSSVESLVYSGTNSVVFTEYDGVKYVSGDTNTVNAGSFNYTVKLDNPAGYTNYVWSGESGDASVANVTVEWSVASKLVSVPVAKTGLIYNGGAQNAFEGLDWSVYELASGTTNETFGGTYEAVFHLTGNGEATNYKWETLPNTTLDQTVPWSIAAAENEISSLSITGWRIGDTPSTPLLTAGFGAETAVYSYGFGDDAESITEWLDDATAIGTAGTWVLRAIIPETNSWAAATGTTTFVMWDDPAMLFHNHVEITVKGSTAELTNFVVPVRISESGMNGFYYDDANPTNLVFIDKSGNLLPFDVDTWDESGESVVWVKIPTLPTEGTSFTFYWNLREGQIVPENTPTDVWSDYVGVWHMSEAAAGGVSVADASGHQDGTGHASSVVAAGVFGKARGRVVTAGNQGYAVTVPAYSELNNLSAGAFMVSGWVKITDLTKVYQAYLFARKNTDTGGSEGWGARFTGANNANELRFWTSGTGGSYYTMSTSGRFAANTWARYDYVVQTGKPLKLYINGALVASSGNINTVVNGSRPFTIGGMGATTQNSTLNGYSDEVRLRVGHMSDAQIAADYKYQTDSTMVTSDVVYKDGFKVDYWVVEPEMDKTQWDVNDADKGQITNYGQLRYGDVTNYIYSVYDESEVYSSTSEITKGGTYRAVFARVPTEDFQPLEKVIEFRITQSKPYSKIGGSNGDSGRILLMNRDTNTQCPIDRQGYSDVASTLSTFWQRFDTDESDLLFNLKATTNSVLWTRGYGERLWHLDNCRHGNTYPKDVASGSLVQIQNYLPYSTTSKSIDNRLTNVKQNTVGQVVMRNMENATVYSPCYTNGIGTIYFDAVNGWTGINDYNNIVVEIATNTVEGLPPTDANCMTVTTNVVDMTEVITTNWYGNLDGCWNACTMRPFVITNGVGFFETNSTKELALQMDIGGRADCFYRVVVPVDYHDEIRFRIRRTSAFSSQIYTVDEGGFILLDNIIASPPAMGGDLWSPGHYDGTKSGKRQLGWELATSVPYPSITDDEVVGRAEPTYYVNYGDGTEPNTDEFFHSAKLHYRWSYLGQVTNDWSTAILNPAADFKATSAFEIPGHECDVEYWYEYTVQAPYYSYVDYSGVGKLLNYTEERGVQTNTCPLGTIMASGGTNWFFRVRDGKSDYSGLDIVFRREGSDAESRSPMVLVGDHVWRGFVQTPTNMEGKISWRIEALDRQTEPYAEYAAYTNHYYCTTEDLALPVSDKLDAGSAESWTALDLDAITGYVMFQVDDQSLGLTVVHADYQNFNVWSDAKGSVFVGNSTSDDSKSGTSPKKQTFTQDFDTWKAMSDTNAKWQFSSFADIRHILGRTAYSPFESAEDGIWESGPGMWVSKEYKNDADNKGVALQMEGQGKGNLRINDVDDAPRGVESVSFNARLGQFVQFRDFNYYNGERHMSMTNYTFMTRVAFDRNSNKDFKGNASLSIVADYLQNKGCYEARWEYIGTGLKSNPSGNKGQRLCLYRWNVTSTGAKETLLTAWTNTISNFNIPAATSLNSSFMPFYITVSNDTANACTWVAAAVCRTSISLGSEWDVSGGPNKAGSNWYIVACRDASGSRLVRGTYGVVSANCDGVFGRPQYSTQTMLTAADELKLAANKAGYYTNKTRTLPTGSNISDKTDGFGTEDSDWITMPGRMKTENGGSTQKSAIVADPAPQTLSIYACTAGKSDWGDTPLTNITVNIFGNKAFSLPLYTTKNCGLRFNVGGLGEENRTDIVIDSVSIRQFRGDDYSDMDEILPLVPDWTNPYSVEPGWGLTNWVFTSAWITNKTTKVGSNVTTNGMMLLSARRTKSGDVSSIRSPLMDGYEYSGGAKRGTGLGMVSYDYEDAQSNAVLLVQIATNNVRSSMLANWDTDDAALWTTVATNDFSKLTATERAKGTISTYIGLHGVTGILRIVVDPDLVESVKDVMDTSRFGEVKISKVVCRDEPALDSACWWGWNLRMVGTVGISDAEGRMYLPDYATDSEDVGMSLALNNSVTDDVDADDKDTYKQHVPFVQTPTFASEVVGEVSFKARRYDAFGAQPASVTLYGSVSGAEDSEWTVLTNFTVEGSVYQTYTYKANMSSRYAAFRLGVSGVPGVKDGGSVQPSGYDTPVRVMIDEVFVSEAVYARMAFRNVGTIRNRDQDEALNRSTWVAGVPGMVWQPLCGEGWGVQCEIYAAQLAQEIDTSFQPEVVLHWFEGTDPWGFAQWRDKTSAEGHKSAALAPVSDTNSFYRSSYESSPGAVVPMSLKPGTVVQYMLEVRYRQVGSDETTSEYLTSADWTRPDWYRPVDFNADLGGGTKEGFSAYCILDTVAPGWAWINEVNLFGEFDNDWNNSEENCQFVEIAAPVEADLTDWKLVFYGGSVEGGGLVTTNVAAVFGTSELPGTKPGAMGAASNMVFRVIACPNAETKGVLKKSDGTLDATWDFSSSYTDTFTRFGTIYALNPFGIQLVRPTGIVEHEIVCIGTNYYGSIPGLEQYYDPTNAVAYFNKYLKDCHMFYAGADEAVKKPSGEYRSLGVFESAGETSNQWNNVMKRTPGRINENQFIDPDHPTPNGESIVVFCNVDSEFGHVWQTVGDAVETNAAVTVFIRRGSTLGTNIVYTVDPWYELGSVTTNGQPVAFGTTGVRKYVANVGAGASNNFTVVAKAAIDGKLVNEYGLTEDEPYRNAIMDWLNKGTDLYGNSWYDSQSGEIKLADLIGLNDQWYTNLSLRAMYWLDMDPTIGNLALKGGMSKAPVPISRTGESGQPVKDIDLGVFMQITNRASGEAWTPYALRGLDPGSSSLSYGGNWTSVTFKVVGFLNTGKTSWRVCENRVPLRWFVFKPDSFVQPGEPGEFTSDIEVIDPFTTESPAFTAGWAEWAAEHGRGQDYYFWDLDDRLVPISVETLKKENKVRVYE